MLLLVPWVLLLFLCSGVCGSGSKLVIQPCDRPLFESKLVLCRSEFNLSLERSEHRYTQDCVWPHVKSSYNALKLCVDSEARSTWCSGVGTLVDDFFMDVHQTYFSECGRIRDPPVPVLVLLVVPLVMCTLLLPLLCTHLTTRDMA
ncbi:receptor activity-modifying protein 1-like [Boleophthalmus pectinirostris]|uniref:receptor activity-modifying protein 1-like n=1 Tax=Boleophthalmus pectinirostris TaxID=150288 RepID=UPI00242C109C|nr:receptor activity-modifying protein 1-like [Boleophthalmus pectinirostris]